MYGGKKDVERIIVYEVELTIENRSSAIVGILDVAGARGTTQFANIENARNLDCAQVSDSAPGIVDNRAMVAYYFNRRLWQRAGDPTW